MTTTALRLKSCPRCKGALALSYDEHGGFWYCIACGYHSYAKVPAEAPIARSEVAKAYYSVFAYAGREKAFFGLKIRGRLLFHKHYQFDLTCPYAGCRHRQLMSSTGHSAGWRVYDCKNRHRIYLNIKKLTWE